MLASTLSRPSSSRGGTGKSLRGGRVALLALGCSLALALALALGAGDARAGQLPASLGAAGSFAALAGSTVTSTLTGFPPGEVNGTIHATDLAATQAQADLTAAYDDAAGRGARPAPPCRLANGAPAVRRSADHRRALCISDRSCSRQHGLYLAYSLGGSFAGRPLENAEATCGRAPTGSGGRSSPFFSVIYGTCRPTAPEGCGPPLEVQSWPACDRNRVSFEGIRNTPGDATPSRRFRVEGVPVASFDGFFEMYLPLTTLVVFFAQNTHLAREALRALPRIAVPNLATLRPRLLCNRIRRSSSPSARSAGTPSASSATARFAVRTARSAR